jgi:hypothetical protein
MPQLKNFVAIDWRSGKDGIHFFFKDINKYSRYSNEDEKIPEGYPSAISQGNWGDFHSHAKNLRFGFTTTSLSYDIGGVDSDASWLFFYVGEIPTVCRYDQDADTVSYIKPLKDSIWAPLLPYFDRIVAGTWWDVTGKKFIFKFIMNDGNHLSFDYAKNQISITYWPGLERYTNRIITGVQKDRTFADNYFYVFLTNNQYLIYNLQLNRLQSGPHAVNDKTWPGLQRG